MTDGSGAGIDLRIPRYDDPFTVIPVAAFPVVEWTETTLRWHSYFVLVGEDGARGCKYTVGTHRSRDRGRKAAQRAIRRRSRRRQRAGQGPIVVVDSPDA